ncbi:MAG: hypothetical protein V7L00_21005 [Nostoc sp.]
MQALTCDPLQLVYVWELQLANAATVSNGSIPLSSSGSYLLVFEVTSIE